MNWHRLLRDGVQSELFLHSELAAELYVDEVLTGDGHPVSLDIPSSVSGLTRFDIRDSSVRELTPLGERLLLSRWPYGSSEASGKGATGRREASD